MKHRMNWFVALSFLGYSVTATAQSANVPVALLGPSQPGERTMTGEATLLGGWRDGQWHGAGAMRPGWPTRWQAITLGQPTQTVTLSAPRASQAPEDEPCSDAMWVKVQGSIPNPRTGTFTVILPAGVRAQPRPVTVFPTINPSYQGIVAAQLKKLGLGNVKPRINTIVQVDLDGDGKKEVLIEASNISTKRFKPVGPTAEGGQYSVVLLRYLKGGQVLTSVLAKDLQVRALTSAEVDQGHAKAMNRYGIAGVVDVNGDGRMEVILASAYYEGDWASILEFTPSWKAAEVAGMGCGV